jgi:hypothetical protein
MMMGITDSIKQSVGRYHLVVALVVICLAFTLVHAWRVRANWSNVHWEDQAFIRHNAATIESVSDCFTKPAVWPGLYRPLTTNLYYYVARKAFANRSEGHHLVNVVLYIGSAMLLYLVSLRLMPRAWALVPPVLWVSRIAHVEVVTNTCEFQSLLSVFLMLLALMLFMVGRKRGIVFGVLSMVSYALALLSKETAVIFPALILVFGRFYDSRAAWRHYLAPIAITAVWALLFATVLRGVTGHRPTGFTYSSGFSDLTLNYGAYLLAFANLLTFRLESIVMVPGIETLAGMFAVKGLLGTALAVSVLALVMANRLRTHHAEPVCLFAFGFLFFVISLSPYVILESRLVMRYAYVGHAGLALAAASLLHLIPRVSTQSASKVSYLGSDP